MKKPATKFLICSGILWSILFATSTQAQVSVLGNAGVATDYVGWNAFQLFPLNVTHRGTQNINFRTNYVLAPVGSGNRMIITNGLFGNTNGRIAMGNDLPNGFIPNARLHLHQTGGATDIRFTNTTTGSGANNGFLIGNSNVGQAFLANYQNDQPITFYTENATGGFNPLERMRINADDRNGFVGIGNTFFFNASAQLHVNNILLTTGLLNPVLYGDLFRTDGLSTRTNAWRMFTGLAGTGNEVFNLTTPLNTQDLQINTVVANSNIFLSANTNNIVHLTSTAATGNNGNGQVLIQSDPLLPDPFPLMDIGGTIRFSEPIVPAGGENTLMYAYTNPQGNPNTFPDGFRMKYMQDAQAPFADCLIFEKTDGAGVIPPNNDPDGCIMFTNTGTDGIEELSMTIEGTGHVGIGHNFNQPLQPWRRLSVFDSIAPQLRLLFTHNIAMNNEIFTDFQTTPIGDLNIDPRNAGVATANIGVVRINYGLGIPLTPHPGISLDVNGQENIRTVNQDNAQTRVLVWEPISGNVRWSSVIGVVTADNGLRMSTPNNVQWGQSAGSLPANSSQLLFDTEVPMNNFYAAFSKPVGQQPFDKNNMVIGTSNAAIAPLARLEVIRDLSIANVANGSPIGLRVENTDIATGTANVGISTGTLSIVNADNKGNFGGAFFATSPNVNNTGNIGVQGTGTNGFANWGVYGDAIGTIGTENNFGGFFNANSTGVTNYGVKCFADNGSLNSYGIWAESPSNLGVNYAGWFEGDVNYTGNLTNISDSILKTNVNGIINASATLSELNPVSYNFDNSSIPQLNVSGGNHYGLIAQQVQNVIPDIVQTASVPAKYDSLGNVINPSAQIKTLNYIEIIPILIAGFNEQQDKIDAQDSTIDAMQQQMSDMMAMLNNCCSQGNSLQAPNNNGNNTNPSNYNVVHSTDVRLTDNYCVLGENSPNPFRDHTVINFNLSQSIQSAQIVFYNMLGEVIKVLEINDRGEGRLNVYGEDLRSGLYTYSLIIDGNVCETKKMIKQ